MSAPLRFPTADETDQGFAIQCAADAARALNPTPREPRDQDERWDEAVPVATVPAPPPVVRTPKVLCDHCGRIFNYATKGMAVLQKNKHMKKDHPESVETY